MREKPQFPVDPEWARRCFRALEIIWQHGLRDELAAELRATAPDCCDEDVCWGASWHHAMDLACAIPEQIMPRKQAEALAIEYVGGSHRKAYLEALETVAAQAKREPAPEPVPVEEPQQAPPEPPADWRSAVQGQGPIVVKSATEAPACVRLAQARKAAGK